MAGLIDRGRRERAREARAERERAIIESAAHLFAHGCFTDVTLDAVGQRAGVPRGTPSLYFGSRAVLFLRVVEAEAAAWNGELERRLGALPATVPPPRLAGPLAASVAARPALPTLLALLPVALEDRGDLSAAVAVVRRLGRILSGAAAALEARAPALGAGGGTAVLRRLAAEAAGRESLARGLRWIGMLAQKPGLAEAAAGGEADVAASLESWLRSFG